MIPLGFFVKTVTAPPLVLTTWNPADIAPAGAFTFSNGNLTALTGAAGSQGVRATRSKSTGKWWIEFRFDALAGDMGVGLASAAFTLDTAGQLGGDPDAFGYYPNTPAQAVYYSGNGLTFGTNSDTPGNTGTLLVDLDAQLLWVTSPAMASQGGMWNNSLTADPATGTEGLSFAGLATPLFPAFNSNAAGAQVTLNGGSSPPTITIPAAFQPWDTP